MWAKKDERNFVYWLICIKKSALGKNCPTSRLLTSFVKASACQFLPTNFFLPIPLLSESFFVLFLRRYVNLRDFSALGFFYEAFLGKIFSCVFMGKERLYDGEANCDFKSGIVGVNFYANTVILNLIQHLAKFSKIPNQVRNDTV